MLHFSTVFLFLHIPTSGHEPSCFMFSQQCEHLMSTVSMLSERCALIRADKVTLDDLGRFFIFKKRKGNSNLEGNLPHAEQVPFEVLSTNFLVISSLPQWTSLNTLKSSDSISSSNRTPSSALRNSSASCCVFLSRYSLPDICATYDLMNATDAYFPTDSLSYI